MSPARLLVPLAVLALAACRDPTDSGMVRLSVENSTGLVVVRTEYRSPLTVPAESAGVYIDRYWLLVSDRPIPDGGRADFQIPAGCWDFRVVTERYIGASGYETWHSGGRLNQCVGPEGYTLRPYRGAR